MLSHQTPAIPESQTKKEKGRIKGENLYVISGYNSRKIFVQEERIMLKTKIISEEDVIYMMRLLPESKKVEVLDFLDFLIQRSREEEGRTDLKRAISAVEDTWGSIKLDKGTLRYIAEDKELEYEI